MKFTGERYLPTEQGRIRLEHYHRYAVVLDIVKEKDVLKEGQVVCTEFGADVWHKTVNKAGFSSCEIVSLEFPAALALIAKE